MAETIHLAQRGPPWVESQIPDYTHIKAGVCTHKQTCFMCTLNKHVCTYNDTQALCQCVCAEELVRCYAPGLFWVITSTICGAVQMNHSLTDRYGKQKWHCHQAERTKINNYNTWLWRSLSHTVTLCLTEEALTAGVVSHIATTCIIMVHVKVLLSMTSESVASFSSSRFRRQ